MKYKVERTAKGWEIFERSSLNAVWVSWGVPFANMWDAHSSLVTTVKALEA